MGIKGAWPLLGWMSEEVKLNTQRHNLYLGLSYHISQYNQFTQMTFVNLLEILEFDTLYGNKRGRVHPQEGRLKR